MLAQGTAKVQQVFNINDKSGSVVAGLNVMNGRLRMSGAHGNFIYRVTRNSEVLVEEDGDQLKRFKSVVHEVSGGSWK